MSKLKTGTTKTANSKLFEFYRVFDNSITDTESNGKIVEPCNPTHQKATMTTLPKVCADAYGAGSFVALQIGENLQGLPLSYWVIKVRAANRRTAREVFLEDGQLRAYRQIRYLIPTEDGTALTIDEGRPYWLSVLASAIGECSDNPLFKSTDFWQRGPEAALASHQLASLPEPQPQTRKAIRALTNTRPEHDFVRELRSEGRLPKEIIPAVMEKFGVSHDRATAIVKNSQRTTQIRRNRKKRQASK